MSFITTIARAISLSALGATSLLGQIERRSAMLLPAPTAVAATVTGSSTTRVTWTPPGGVLGHEVTRYRADNLQSIEASSGQLSGATTQWDDRGLLAGVTYQYVVTALYSGGTAKATASVTMPATATVIASTGTGVLAKQSGSALTTYQPAATGATISLAPAPAPAAPTGVTVSGTTGGVAVRWQAVAGATSYRILRAPDATSPAGMLGVVPNTAGLYVDNSLPPYTPAWYQVVTIAADGRSAASAAVAFTPPPAPPVLTAISPLKPYPGQTVTLTGNYLSSVTAIKVSSGPIAATGGLTLAGVVAPNTIKATGVNQVSFQWPLNGGWWDGIDVTLEVTNAGGTVKSPFTVSVDRRPVITGATRPVARAGYNIELTGRNLDGAGTGFIGDGPINSATNPPLTAQGGWLGLSAIIRTPTNCSRKGALQLQGSYAVPGYTSWTTATITSEGATPVQGGCGVTPTGNYVSPQVAKPGSTVRIAGKGFTWLTGIQYGGASLKWTPISDIELDLELPVPGSPDMWAGGPISVSLVNSIPDGNVTGTVNPAPISAYPPLIQSLSAVWGECCENIAINGKWLSNPVGGKPTVKVNGVQVQVLSTALNTVVFQMPYPANGDPGGPAQVTIEHAGGSAVAPNPLIVVTDNSAITSISPATIAAGVATTVTVTGTNLARARGICLPGASPTGPFVLRTDQVTNNTQMQVVVQSPAVSGPVWVAVPPNLQQRQYTICQANPTTVNIAVH